MNLCLFGDVVTPHIGLEFVAATVKWAQLNGESPLLLCWGSSIRLSFWLAQGDA